MVVNQGFTCAFKTSFFNRKANLSRGEEGNAPPPQRDPHPQFLRQPRESEKEKSEGHPPALSPFTPPMSAGARRHLAAGKRPRGSLNLFGVRLGSLEVYQKKAHHQKEQQQQQERQQLKHGVQVQDGHPSGIGPGGPRHRQKRPADPTRAAVPRPSGRQAALAFHSLWGPTATPKTQLLSGVRFPPTLRSLFAQPEASS